MFLTSVSDGARQLSSGITNLLAQAEGQEYYQVSGFHHYTTDRSKYPGFRIWSDVRTPFSGFRITHCEKREIPTMQERDRIPAGRYQDVKAGRFVPPPAALLRSVPRIRSGSSSNSGLFLTLFTHQD